MIGVVVVVVVVGSVRLGSMRVGRVGILRDVVLRMRAATRAARLVASAGVHEVGELDGVAYYAPVAAEEAL